MANPEPGQSGAVFDLAAIEQEMRREDGYVRDGHTARTLVREDDLRVVLIVMRAGSRIADHVANETVSIQTLSGNLRLQLPRQARQREDRMLELPAGRLLMLERGDEHGVHAVSDSAFLLSFGWRDKAKT